MDQDLAIDVVKLQEQNKTLFTNIENIKQDIKEMSVMVRSIQEMSFNVKLLAQQMATMQSDIKVITNEPSKAWKNFKWLIVGATTTGIIGSIVGIILKYFQ